MSTRLITQADHDKMIDVRQGDRITLTLPENPTTGYRWDLEQHDASALEPAESPDFRPAGPATGAGGARSFSFVARTPGEHSLTLSRRRPWEKQAPAADNFRVTLHVHE